MSWQGYLDEQTGVGFGVPGSYEARYLEANSHLPYAYPLSGLSVSTPAAPAAVAASTGVNPVEMAYSLYGKIIPLSVLGVGRIGGNLSVGPWIENGLGSAGLSFGVPADPTGTRTAIEIAFDSEVVWDSTNGFYTESFTFRFYGGTYTQAADPLETAHFGADAVAYRPQMMLFIENLPLANTKFKKFPYVAVKIQDASGDDVNVGEAFERLAYSPWVGWTSSQFETVDITDALPNGGLIFAEPAEFLGTIQQFGRFYRTWDILQTDKLRIVDRGATTTADLTLDKTRLMGNVVIALAEPNSVPRKLELSTIDPDADHTIVPSTAQRPLAPVAVTTSVATEAAYLPAIMDSPTRLAVVTYAKYAEEQARKKISGTAMMYGLELEPGALLEIADLGDDFHDETFKVVETLHGANYAVEFTAEAILKCTVDIEPGESTTPGAAAQWAVSRSRILVPGYAGAWDSVVSGRVQTLYDQSGNARDISAGTSAVRPIATTSGPNSRACCDFSPTSSSVGHSLQTGVGDPMSDLISNSTGYMVVSIRPDVVTQNSTVAAANANVLKWGPFYGVGGLSLRTGGILYAYNNDGGEDKAASAMGAVPVGGNPCVIEWRHQGGNLYQRVNGANETVVASGNTTDMTDPLKMGFGSATGTFYDGKIFEAMIYSTVPTEAERDAIVADMMTWVGA